MGVNFIHVKYRTPVFPLVQKNKGGREMVHQMLCVSSKGLPLFLKVFSSILDPSLYVAQTFLKHVFLLPQFPSAPPCLPL